MRSTKKKPQMTELEIKYVESLALNFDTIVEFGSGLSTLKWSKTFASVISIETRFEWFNKIKTLTEVKSRNVKMIFSPPESSAYSENGEELWNTRVPTDYGLESEFAGYLETAKKVIENQVSPCVIFIDANMRTQILEIAFNSDISHEILVHDVIPERSYLNLWMNKYSESVVTQVDSLVHVKRI
jgi:hypothetical protein